jgi:hypothetical protein
VAARAVARPLCPPNWQRSWLPNLAPQPAESRAAERPGARKGRSPWRQKQPAATPAKIDKTPGRRTRRADASSSGCPPPSGERANAIWAERKPTDRHWGQHRHACAPRRPAPTLARPAFGARLNREQAWNQLHLFAMLAARWQAHCSPRRGAGPDDLAPAPGRSGWPAGARGYRIGHKACLPPEVGLCLPA